MAEQSGAPVGAGVPAQLTAPRGSSAVSEIAIGVTFVSSLQLMNITH